MSTSKNTNLSPLPRLELADIFREYGRAYLQKFGERMPPRHRTVIKKIIACRTETLGGKVFRCKPCNMDRYSYHSCQNRHCSKCGNDQATEWLKMQSALLLPVTYFMLTFTLPHTFHAVARSNQAFIYSLFIQTAAAALQKLARDPKYVGGQLGFFGVQQTWTRDLAYRPHLHFIIAGGGLSLDGMKWLSACEDFLVPVKALSKIFRVAISNRRLLKLENGNVTFRYRQGDTKRLKTRTVTAQEFIRRFLQHVLPHRFIKVRYYGFLLVNAMLKVSTT